MYIVRTFVLDAPRQRAWAFLNEPEEIGRCLPGCHAVEVIGPGRYKASVGLKVGPIKASFDVLVDTTEERPLEYGAYTMRGADKDGGSKISADCTLALADLGDRRTQVTYTSEVRIVGKLGKFAGGVMQKFADGINDQFITALTRRVGELEVAVAEPERVAEAERASEAAGESAFFRFLSRILRSLKSLFGKQRTQAAK